MSPNAQATPTVTPMSLIDEVMGVLQRGENALFADLARSTWDARATLADLTGTLSHTRAAA